MRHFLSARVMLCLFLLVLLAGEVHSQIKAMVHMYLAVEDDALASILSEGEWNSREEASGGTTKYTSADGANSWNMATSQVAIPKDWKTSGVCVKVI